MSNAESTDEAAVCGAETPPGSLLLISVQVVLKGLRGEERRVTLAMHGGFVSLFI